MAVWIGTSGWNYPHWGNGVFYPRGLPVSEWLSFYATHFPAVEINSTFYRLPSPEVLRRWGNATPDHFRFSAKASRFITHMKKLAAPEIHAARFLERIGELGEKLATVLFQLPPFWKFDQHRLIDFAQFLSRQKLVPGLRFAIEFRHPSWLVSDTLEILRDHRIALVHSDPRGLSIPRTATTDFVYLRRHGPSTLGRIGYTNCELESDARWIARETRAAHDILCFFNNDSQGAAIHDAMQLLRRADRPSRSNFEENRQQ